MQVQLLKQFHNYVDKKGEERTATNFYVKCGDSMIPVEVRYFPNDEGVDPNYRARKMVLSSFAEEFINSKNPKKSQNAEKGENGEKIEAQNP